METSIDCQVHAESQISPSESHKKVLGAMLNMLPDCEYRTTHNTVQVHSKNIMDLDTIRKSMSGRRSSNSLKKILLRNADDTGTWFFLNRQAAFVGIAAICEEAGESPLGPIKITLASPDIQGVIEWFSHV